MLGASAVYERKTSRLDHEKSRSPFDQAFRSRHGQRDFWFAQRVRDFWPFVPDDVVESRARLALTSIFDSWRI